MFNCNYGHILHRFDIFDIEKYCNLEIWVRDHSKSSKLVPFDSIPMVPISVL